MAKTKDFFGKDITEVIEQACKFYETTQDQLDIEILETGSAGIFGLCRKQAHIRATRKESEVVQAEPAKITPAAQESRAQEAKIATGSSDVDEMSPGKAGSSVDEESDIKEEMLQTGDIEKKPEQQAQEQQKGAGEKKKDSPEEQQPEAADTVEPPSQESLDAIAADVNELLELMNFPSQVEVTTENCNVHCNISSEYEEDIIGPEGRTLDSLQYLLRKMLMQNLPDRFMLSLDVGDFRERRAEELKERAVVLAAQVKEDGKTQAIPALNPSERRIVHMVLQEDKAIRSRSVGDGLFKKVLIYKPGKGRRSGPKRRKG